MRKFTYLLTMLALALGFSVARADVVTPYAYDFSGLGSGKLVSSFGVSRNLVGINFRHPNVMPNFAVWKTITYRHWHRWCCQPRF